MSTPYGVLNRKRAGERLSEGEIREVVAGTGDGGWSDAQLGAFLMAAAIQGLDEAETRALTQAMLESGDRWNLAADAPSVGDKHSTGGVGDKVSLILSPLLAACGQPVAMLTGRGLGHTGGTADKLEAIPGLDLALDRRRALASIEAVGFAVGMATGDVAPADRRLYALRDVTGTVESRPLIIASILSKKLATGTAGVIFDLKAGNGAFIRDPDEGRALGLALAEISSSLGTPARTVITDMSQPLGRWAGHACEVQETLDALGGDGPEDLMEVTYVLCEELADLLGAPLSRPRLEEAISSGRARELFERWAVHQGVDAGWFRAPELPLAPVEVVAEAPEGGVLTAVENRQLGLILSEAGGGRQLPGDSIDPAISLCMNARLGDAVEASDELARLYLRTADDDLAGRFRACFTIEPDGFAGGDPPALIRERLRPAD